VTQPIARCKHAALNRILVQAEPQVGKTGTYLHLIKLLQQAFDTTTKGGLIEVLDAEVLLPVLLNDWQHPSQGLRLENQIANMRPFTSKYTPYAVRPYVPGEYPFVDIVACNRGDEQQIWDHQRVGGSGSAAATFCDGPLELGPAESLISLPPSGCSSRLVSVAEFDDFRAFNAHHRQTCDICKQAWNALPEATLYQLDVPGCVDAIHMSVPPSMLDCMQISDTGQSVISMHHRHHKPDMSKPLPLRSFVFTPSIRPDVATLNWHHALGGMLEVNHFIVCQKGKRQFDRFRELWGRSHAIVQLPDEMTLDKELWDNTDVAAWTRAGWDKIEGGVITNNLRCGYARLFIQRLCDHFELDTAFQFDDTVDLFYEYDLTDASLKTGYGTRVVKRPHCHFAKPMMQLERQLANDQSYVDALTHALSSKPDADLYADPGKDIPESVLLAPNKEFPTTVQQYSGSAADYAMLGFARDGMPAVTKRPFGHSHVYSAVLVNMKALRAHKVTFLPFPFWEDLSTQWCCDLRKLKVR